MFQRVQVSWCRPAAAPPEAQRPAKHARVDSQPAAQAPAAQAQPEVAHGDEDGPIFTPDTPPYEPEWTNHGCAGSARELYKQPGMPL